jgi:hypothetical protein
MTRFTITVPLYLDGVRRGDPIVVGYGGDHPDTVLDKLLASHTTIAPHLGSKELDQVEPGWPKRAASTSPPSGSSAPSPASAPAARSR